MLNVYSQYIYIVKEIFYNLVPRINMSPVTWINPILELVVLPLPFVCQKAWFKRSKVLGIGLFASGAISALCVFLTDATFLRVATFVGRAVISCCVSVNYIYTTEMYPTVIRARGLGFGSICGRLGGMLGPQIYKLAGTIHWLPGVIVASISITAGLLRWVTLLHL